MRTWLPGEDAPMDASQIWGVLETGEIARVAYLTAQTIANIFDDDVEYYDSDWCLLDANYEPCCRPKWWLPEDAIPLPPSR